MTGKMTPCSKASRMMALALAGTVLAGPMLAAPALAAAKKPAPAAAAEQEPALTREEARQHAAAIFDQLDVNHDGVVNAADGKARRDARLGAMFDRLDTNHDGMVTRAEFIAAHDGPHGPRGDGPPPPPGAGPDGEAARIAFSPMAFAILRQADPQHTGSVTKEAFIAAELKRFDEADANHDGKVTREEMRAARHARHRWRHEREDDRDGPGHDRPWGPPRDHHDGPPPPPLPAEAK
jgi:Ca2+-binding EF-hand superfamily protein